MNLLVARLAAAAVLAVLAACGAVPGSRSISFYEAPPAAAQTAAPAPAPRVTVAEFDAADAAETGELRFQTGDVVKVALWGYPELDHLAVVQPNGNITVPLVGEVIAAESTVAQLRERIAEGLKPFTRVSTPDLRAGDVLHFRVWREESLQHSAVIEPGGYATFPIVGQVRAAGRSVEEIRAEAERRLAGHLRDPKVSVMPSYSNRRVLQDHSVSVLPQQLQPRRIAVIGDVAVPGLSELRPGMRVVDALAQHSVRQATAAINSVVVIRNPRLGPPRYRVVRLADYLEGQASDENIALRNGDIVIVPKTPIAKAGEFVELFFTRTLPVFQWWAGLWNASVARDQAETVRLINEALERQLTTITVTPP